jgi:hypothetical protein
MTYHTTEERQKLRDKWIARIEDWKNSGLSRTAWCKRENLADHQFYYWKKLLSDEPKPKLDAKSFIELEDHSDSSGIEIALNGIIIHVAKNFHSATLQQCIMTLKGAKC